MLRDHVLRDRGQRDADLLEQFRLSNKQVVVDTAREVLACVPEWFGACAPMSAMWAALLRHHHDIPAVVVAGDLIIEGTTVFRCGANIPDPANMTQSVSAAWDGHCWIEIDGYIGDVSITRTARKIDGPSILKAFIQRNFGLQRGGMLYKHSNLLAMGMNYIPKYALTDSQMKGLIAGMKHQIHRGRSTP